MGPMGPLALAAIGAGVGLLKSNADRQRAERQRQMESEVARYSPWTGFAPQRVQEADPLGSVMQGGMTGAMLGQGMAGADKQNALLDAQTKYYQGQMGPQAGMGGGSPWMYT